MVKVRQKKSRKPDELKSRGNPGGLSNEMMAWIEKEAQGRNVYKASIIQEALEWYRTALDRQRGDETVQELFDKNPIVDPIKNKSKEK